MWSCPILFLMIIFHVASKLMYQSNNITAFKTILNIMLFIFVYKIKTKNQSKYCFQSPHVLSSPKSAFHKVHAKLLKWFCIYLVWAISCFLILGLTMLKKKSIIVQIIIDNRLKVEKKIYLKLLKFTNEIKFQWRQSTTHYFLVIYIYWTSSLYSALFSAVGPSMNTTDKNICHYGI